MDRTKPNWWWQALLGITLLGLFLRSSHLGQRYLWYDEALLLEPSDLAGPALDHAMTVWTTTTYNPGWAFVVWVASRLPGDTLLMARLASLLVGTLTIPAAAWAARSLGLGRGPAVVAALLTAVSWPLIDYSQQVLPYAPLPLLSFVCVALLGSTGRMGLGSPLPRVLAMHAAILIACLVYLSIHNSFVIFLPLVGSYLALNALSAPAEEGTARTWRIRALRASLALGIVALVALSATPFVMGNPRAGFRPYLRPYYLTTFRAGHIFDYLGTSDRWYMAGVGRGGSSVLDVAYFSVSRSIDWLAYHLVPFYASSHGFWWLGGALPGLVLFAIGATALLRGRAGRTATLFAVGGVAAVGMTLVLSLARFYPYGGLRQMLPLAPLVLLPTAYGTWRVLGRFPHGAGVLAGCLLGAVVLSAPDYAQDNQTSFNEIGLRILARRAEAKAIVAGDGEWSAGVLRFLCRHPGDLRVVRPGTFDFDALLASREPFLLVSKAGPALKHQGGRWVLAPSFLAVRPRGFDIENYSVEPLRVEQPTNYARGAVAYAIRPAGTTPASGMGRVAQRSSSSTERKPLDGAEKSGASGESRLR